MKKRIGPACRRCQSAPGANPPTCCQSFVRCRRHRSFFPASTAAARFGRHLLLFGLGLGFGFPGQSALFAHLALFGALGDIKSRGLLLAAAATGSGTACFVGTHGAAGFPPSAAPRVEVARNRNPDRRDQGRDPQPRQHLLQIPGVHPLPPFVEREKSREPGRAPSESQLHQLITQESCKSRASDGIYGRYRCW